MAGYRGVSTKHLQSYLDWFEWRRMFCSDSLDDDGKLLARQPGNGLYRSRRTSYISLRSPYLYYWACDKRIGSSSCLHCNHRVNQELGGTNGEHPNDDDAHRSRTQGDG